MHLLVVDGIPGSGKTTLVRTLSSVIEVLGQRVAVVQLDSFVAEQSTFAAWKVNRDAQLTFEVDRLTLTLERLRDDGAVEYPCRSALTGTIGHTHKVFKPDVLFVEGRGSAFAMSATRIPVTAYIRVNVPTDVSLQRVTDRSKRRSNDDPQWGSYVREVWMGAELDSWNDRVDWIEYGQS